MVPPQSQSRFDAAALVVEGRVTAVRTLPHPMHAPWTEHDPVWRIATVAVDRVVKGADPGATVEVRFASSTDVAWYKAPKFTVGQEGTFFLETGHSPKVYAATIPGAFVSRTKGEREIA